MKRGLYLTVNNSMQYFTDNNNRLTAPLTLRPYEFDYAFIISNLIDKAYFLSDFSIRIPSIIIDISLLSGINKTLMIDSTGRVWKSPAHPLNFIEVYTSTRIYKYSLWNKFLQQKLSKKLSTYPYIDSETILIPIEHTSITPTIWINLKQCHHFHTYKSFLYHSHCDYLGYFSLGYKQNPKVTLVYPLFSHLTNQIVLAHKLSLDWLVYNFSLVHKSLPIHIPLSTLLDMYHKNSVFKGYYEVNYQTIDYKLFSIFNDIRRLDKVISSIPCKILSKKYLDFLLDFNIEAALLYEKIKRSSNGPQGSSVF